MLHPCGGCSICRLLGAARDLRSLQLQLRALRLVLIPHMPACSSGLLQADGLKLCRLMGAMLLLAGQRRQIALSR